MSTNSRLSALNETAEVEVGRTLRAPVQVTYTNRFYGTCVMTARLKKLETGAPELIRTSLAFGEVEVRRGTPEALKSAAESFLIGQLQRNPECFLPQATKGSGSASESILEPALRQLRRLTP
jgi:hypothetical protein